MPVRTLHGDHSTTVRARARWLLVLGTLVTGGLMTMSAHAATPPAYAAKASLQPALYYINDTAGSVYTFTVKNTGTTTSIGAVEIRRPSTGWRITSCPTAPAGWSKSASAELCRYRSAETKSDDIKPGKSATFAVKARTEPGTANRTGTWKVTVSSSNQFDNPNLLKPAGATGAGLTTLLYTFELTTAVVGDGTPVAGSACPPENKSAPRASQRTIIVCGKNRASTALTPLSSYSTLGGTFVKTPGTFLSGSIPADSDDVILASWVATEITDVYGDGKKVIAGIGASANRTSPLRTFTGYEAVSNPADAVDDAYAATEDTPLTVTAPGVLANDSDPDGDPITATNASDPANGTVALAADGSFTYTPDPDFHGVDTFTYTANDTFSDSAPATVTITVAPVADAPVAADDTASTSEDAATAIPVLDNDTDADADALAVSAVDTTGTNGVVTNHGTHVSYDPNGQFEALRPGETATDSFTYTVSDGGLTDTATVTVTVTGVNDTPVAADDSATTAEDTPVVVNILANDTDAEGALTYTVGTATNGTAVDNGDGTVTFTPDADFSGTASFGYTVTDVDGATDTATVTITVTGVNDVPVATDDTATVGEDSAGQTVDVLANDTDAEAATLTVSAVDTTGTNGTVTNNGTDVTYDPNGQFEALGAGETATDSFTYTVSDGDGGTDVATVTITVTGVNDAPVVVDDTATTAEDTPVTVSPLANDSDAEGALTITGVSNATNGTAVDNGDGTVTFTPAANFSGTASFDYTATDLDGASDTGTVTITVTPVNDVPVAADDTPSTSEDAATVVPVLDNDTDADGDTLTVSAVDTTGTNGVVTNNGTDVSYDPNGQFDSLAAGETAQDTFTYTVSDGNGGTDTATVTVTVTGVNDAPVANDDSYQTTQDTALVVAAPGVLTNDTDADASDVKTASSASDPANGTVTLGADGSFTYTPDAGFTGTDTWTYVVSDGNGGSDSATVTITVVPPNATPTADATSASGNEDGGAITVTLTGHDADGDPLTFTAGTATNGLVTVPGAVTCDGNTPSTCSTTVSYTPNADFFGSDAFTYTVNDGTVDSAPATASITVNSVNDAPSFTKGADQSVLEDAGVQSVSGWATAISAGPANESGQVVSFVVTTDNDGLFSALPAVDGGGTLTYTPAVDANGVATVSVSAMDDGGTANGGDDTSDVQTFTITVGAVNDAPSFTKGADQTLNEDAGAQSVSNWATAISKGPANESGQTLSFTTSNDNNALFSVQPGVTPTGTLVFTTAPNTYGSATVTISLSDNGGTANGGDDTSDSQTFTITVNAVNDPPVAAAKSFTVQTNMKISLGGLLTGATDTNDTAQEPGYTPTFTLGSITAGAGCVGCTISNVDNANGTFDFEPPAGGTGTYTVSYTVVDSGFPAPGATSASQTITFTVSGPVIWFVDGTSGSDLNTGTLTRPFATLAKAATVDAANQRIFVHSGTYSDGITLLNGEWLTGAGSTGTSFDTLMGITPPAGTAARPTINATRPTIQGSVALGSGNTVRGLTLSGGPALSGTSFGTLTLASSPGADVAVGTTGQALDLSTGTVDGDFVSVSSSGGAHNVSLTSVGTTGTTSLGTGSLSAATGDGLRISGGTGSFDYSGTIANASGTTVNVLSKTGGTVSLTGAVSDTAGAGVALTNNGGATISLTGGVTLTSGTSPAFLATGGGTVSVTGAANTLSSTTGTPLTVTDTTIGAADLTFRSIASNGAARGIYLSNTGSSGNLVVTGNGGTCTLADTSGCSGGTIANSSGSDDSGTTPVGTGIVLNNTRDVSLTRMLVSTATNYGIRGTAVTNLTVASSVVTGTVGTNAATPFNDGGMKFANLTGTASFTGVQVSGGHSDNVAIDNTSGTLNVTFDALRLGSMSTSDGNDGLQVEGAGTATVNVTVQNSTFTSARGDQFQFIADGSGGGNLTFTGNTMTNNHPGIATGGGGITITGGAAGPSTMTVTGNTVRDAVGHAFLFVKSPGAGSVGGTFGSNTIGVAGVANSGSLEGSGVSFVHSGTNTMGWTITNNQIHQYNNFGISLQSGAGVVAAGTLNATISGNTVANPGTNAAIGTPFQGIGVNSGVTPGDTFTTCVDFGANTVTGSGRNGGTDVRVRQRQDTTVRLPGYAGGATDTAAVVSFVQGKLGGSPTVSATASGTGGGFVGTAC